MLHSSEVIGAVVDEVARLAPNAPLVVDPVGVTATCTVTALTAEEVQAGEFSLSLGYRFNRFTTRQIAREIESHLARVVERHRAGSRHA